MEDARSLLVPSVLIVEDEAALARNLEAALHLDGFKVAHTTSTSSEALAWLAHSSPDSAVLDLSQEDRDGFQVAQLLVARAIPFVISSVRDFDEEGECDPVLLWGQWVSKPSPAIHVVTALNVLLFAHTCGL